MKMATKVYNMDWYRRDIRTQRKILFIILRSQKYESFGINGIVPALSLSYYGKVYTFTVSFYLCNCYYLILFHIYPFMFCSIYTHLCRISMHYVLWLKIQLISLSWNSMIEEYYIWKMYVYTIFHFIFHIFPLIVAFLHLPIIHV